MSQTDSTLKIFVLGFAETELRLLDAAVRLSERRKPVLQLVAKDDCAHAQVWLIDGHAPVEDKKWAVRQLRTMPDTVVIWVDAAKIPANHTALQRPVPWVNLPAILGKAIEQQSQAADFKTQETGLSVPASGKHEILVVDDSAPARQHLRGLLQGRGFAVSEAETAEAALAMLQPDTAYAAVLMDIMLPGMDGYEACRQIRARFASLPVIMLTGRASPFDRIRGSMAGCNAYLTKPPDPAELYDLLSKYSNLV
jgi:twitching motility two-component system response regulator PilG